MKKIIEFLKNWFEKNGMIKILVSFAILITCVALSRKFPQAEWIAIVGVISGSYLILTVLIFMIAGIVNTIKDLIKKKK